MNTTTTKVVSYFLDTNFCNPFNESNNQTLWVSFSPQRSGQHVVISWICTGIGNLLHFNHCRFFISRFRLELQPMTGRRVIYQHGNKPSDSGIQGRPLLQKSLDGIGPMANILYSMEDLSPEMVPYKNLIDRHSPKTIVILRDPCNWIASSLQHGKSSKSKMKRKVENYKSLLRLAGNTSKLEQITFIDYKKFVLSEHYRKELADCLQLPYFEEAEKTLSNIPDFGGGSSFKKETHDVDSLFSRWVSFKDDKVFLELIQDKELWKLSEDFFGKFPGMEELQSIMERHSENE